MSEVAEPTIVAGRFVSDDVNLRRAVSIFLAGSPRTALLPDKYRKSARLRHRRPENSSGFHAEFYACPLPIWYIPTLGCPFVLDTSLSEYEVSGEVHFDRLDDPLLKEMLHLVFARESARCVLSGSTKKENGASLDFFCFLRRGEFAELSVEWHGGIDDVPRLEAITEHSRLGSYRSSVRRQEADRGKYSFEAVPKVECLQVLSEALSQIGFSVDSTSAKLYVACEVLPPAEATDYEKLRPLLNRLSTNWHSDWPVYYSEHFDIFLRPSEIPTDTLECRFPVIQILSKSLLGPKLQVDVVHRPSCSSLEFLSIEGEPVLNKAAKAAGVKLEMWEGPLHLRWRE